MEPKFKVQTVQTEQLLREMAFASMGRFPVGLYTGVGIFAILTAILMLFDGTFDTAIILIVMGLLLFVIAYLRPFLHARQQFRRNRIVSGGAELTPTELTFFDDRVVTYNSTVEKEITFTYDQFKKLKKTKHLYLLKLPEQLYLLIDRGGFMLGTPAEFEAFIKEKLKK